jgi:hypothetical protein
MAGTRLERVTATAVDRDVSISRMNFRFHSGVKFSGS